MLPTSWPSQELWPAEFQMLLFGPNGYETLVLLNLTCKQNFKQN